MLTSRRPYQIAALFVAIPTLMAFPGCTASTEVPSASRLTIVQGQGQTAAAGNALSTPAVLRVLGSNGAPIAKIPVSLNVLAGGGTVDPATNVSDENGEVKAKWTLGPAELVNTLSASAPGADPLLLSASGILPTDVLVAQGNTQTAKAAAALPVPLTATAN
jgi:hypothetical protein